MNIKQLEYFISVAQNLSFTKAAKEHYLSQTAISQQIKNLEESIGFQLFFRTKQSVKLTPAGETFYVEAKIIIDKLNVAINKSFLVSSGYIGTLTIGFLEGHEKVFLPKLLSKFKESYPNINLNIIKGNMNSLYTKLQTGLIDLVFSFNFDINKYSDVSSKTIGNYPICAILYNDHPLSSRDVINRSELKNEDFIFLDRSTSPFGFDCMLSHCIDAGFSPNIIYTSDSIETILLMVEAKLGITMLPRFNNFSSLGNLKFIDLKDETTESVISWNKNNNTLQLKTFLTFVDDILKNYDYTQNLKESTI